MSSADSSCFSSHCDFYSSEVNVQSKYLRACVCHPRVTSRQHTQSHISKIRSWNWNCILINVFIKQFPPQPKKKKTHSNKINSTFFCHPQNPINRRDIPITNWSQVGNQKVTAFHYIFTPFFDIILCGYNFKSKGKWPLLTRCIHSASLALLFGSLLNTLPFLNRLSSSLWWLCLLLTKLHHMLLSLGASFWDVILNSISWRKRNTWDQSLLLCSPFTFLTSTLPAPLQSTPRRSQALPWYFSSESRHSLWDMLTQLGWTEQAFFTSYCLFLPSFCCPALSCLPSVLVQKFESTLRISLLS